VHLLVEVYNDILRLTRKKLWPVVPARQHVFYTCCLFFQR